MFGGGSAMSIPRNMIPGLKRASTSKLDDYLGLSGRGCLVVAIA